jgi:hypothetical protein
MMLVINVLRKPFDYVRLVVEQTYTRKSTRQRLLLRPLSSLIASL